MYLTQ
ncbi:9c9d32bf-7994-417e-a83e-2535a2b6e378 [Thermothielavioides terrestris]